MKENFFKCEVKLCEENINFKYFEQLSNAYLFKYVIHPNSLWLPHDCFQRVQSMQRGREGHAEMQLSLRGRRSHTVSEGAKSVVS